MNVRCPSCATTYRIDPSKVPESGVRASCAICEAVIELSRSPAPPVAAAAPSPMAPPPGRHESRGFTQPMQRVSASHPVQQPVRPATPSRGVRLSRPFFQASLEAAEPAAPAPAPAPAPAKPPPAPRPPRPSAPVFTPGSGTVVTPPIPPARAPEPEGKIAPDLPLIQPEPRATEPAVEPEPVTAPEPEIPPVPEPEIPPVPEPPPVPQQISVPVPEPVAVPETAPPKPERPQTKPINPFLQQDPRQKARRLARALVSDMIVYQPEKRNEALKSGTLKDEFEEEIKKSWQEYVEQVGEELANSTNFFTEALNEILAGGEPLF